MPSRPISQNSKPSIIERSRVVLLALVISAIAIFLLIIIYLLYHLWDTLFHRSRTNPFDSATPLKLQKFSYKELKSATNRFNPDNCIGKGGSGTVYRGILRDGKSVAIKKLDAAASLHAEREFQSELTILGSVRSPHIVSLLGYCFEKNKRILVYEYLSNRSLQEFLFSDDDLLCINWDRRFQIIQDVARALDFLHNECDPPIIHGDIKPSNVLLDWDFKAKISDFGLSRVKVEDEFGVDMFSQELWKSQELSGNLIVETPTVGTPIEGQCSSEVDFALALQASSSSKITRVFHNCAAKGTPKGKEVLVETGGEDLRKVGGCDNELSSVEHSKELDLNPSLGMDDAGDTKQWGKDWWWRQDDSGELCSKEYVTEWIGTQMCPSPNPDWKNTSSPIKSSLSNSPQLDKFKPGNEHQGLEFHLRCLDEKGFDRKDTGDKNIQKNKPRKMQDWWKEEQLDDEMSKRGSKRKNLLRTMKKSIKMPHFVLGRRFHLLKRMRSSEHNRIDGNLINHGFSFKKGWRRKNARSMGSDQLSGDMFSRELSSTTSMRGTLCYVAPEYGGCGYLMEKGDIYSFGVLILVIISGRRPIHVLNSPMKLEKANLISWCRHLAQTGNVIEIVDERMKEAYNKDQATLCIHLALACLQKLPELRPDIGDVVRILRGEMDLTPLPYEFSPSPRSKFYSRSSRKQKTIPE